MRVSYLAWPLCSGVALAYDCKVTERKGCFADGGAAPTKDLPAILGYKAADGDGSLTKETCASLCFNAGYDKDSLMGVEYGSQCFCGHTYLVDNPQVKDDADCNKACTGDSSETCGGTFRIEVFQATCSGEPDPSPYCKDPSAKWCDHTLPLEDRVEALVSSLTADEKAALFRNGVGSIDRIGWPAYNWWSEALHGVARDGLATSFPQILGVSSSLNRTLWKELGDMTSTEGRGKNGRLGGGQYQGLTFWAPNVNIFRDPRWGRGQETPGEDPTINGDYAVAYVSGLQGDDDTYLKTSACLKHYAAYSEEEGRNSFPAVVTKQDMEDTYLPAFEAGVTRGKASSIMCSYNAETYGYGLFGNGTQDGAIPSCANKYLLNDLAREKWGFNGYITSDCGAVGNVQNQHKYTSNPDDTVRAVLGAGMDTDCGGFMKSDVMKPIVADGADGTKLTDNALKNLFRVQLRLGFADPPSLVPWSSYGNDVVNTPEHQALARTAADQSLVLFKNDGALPLKADPSKKMKILVAGRNAKATGNMQGNYYGTAPFLVSPFDGLSKLADTIYDDGKDASSAAAKVADVDAVVLVVGLTSEAVRPNDESEGHDRTSLRLPTTDGDQEALISQVGAAANGKPVIVVVMSGSAVDVSAAKESSDIGAIMWCGYPGQSGGDAIADAIFGNTNRFGKSTITWYPEEFVSQIDLKDMNMRPDASSGRPGRSHRFYDGPTVFKFGDGLSYTTFDHEVQVHTLLGSTAIQHDLQARPLRKDARVAARASVAVSNTGDREGDAVVMLFASPPEGVRGVNGAPLQTLVGFERVTLAAGASTNMAFDITSYDLSYATSDGSLASAEGEWKFWVGNTPSSKAVGSVHIGNVQLV